MTDPVYCYPPEHAVLRNKFDIRDARALEATEREIVAQRTAEGCPKGNFDLNHLRTIHHHLFQDVYDWAGSVRTVDMSKGGSQFMPRQFIETGMADVHRRIVEGNRLQGLNPDQFAAKAGEIIGDINHVHPFREGNGRTQLQYLSQLAEQAGHPIDLRKIDREAWIDASIRSNDGDHDAMRASVRGAMEGDRERGGLKQTARAIADKFRRDREDDKEQRLAQLEAIREKAQNEKKRSLQKSRDREK